MYEPDFQVPTTKDQAEQQGWRYLTEGTTRVLYTHPDYPGVVLKLMRPDRSNNLNKREANAPSSRYLTPVLYHTECYSALLVPRERYVTGAFANMSPDHDPYSEELKNNQGLNSFIQVNEIIDAHGGNLAYGVDDYGNHFPIRIVDYTDVHVKAFTYA